MSTVYILLTKILLFSLSIKSDNVIVELWIFISWQQMKEKLRISDY